MTFYGLDGHNFDLYRCVDSFVGLYSIASDRTRSFVGGIVRFYQRHFEKLVPSRVIVK